MNRLRLFKRKSSNLFEPPESAKWTKILHITFPNFDLNQHEAYYLRFKRLQELEIMAPAENNKLLPEEIGQLVKLNKLYLLNFDYTEIPNWIFNLAKLKKLCLRGMNIEKIQDQICELKNLETLRIENCQLTDLPVSLSKLKKLKQLSLVDNFKLTNLNLQSLPESLKVMRLVPSGLTDEKMNEIKSKFPKIKFGFVD